MIHSSYVEICASLAPEDSIDARDHRYPRRIEYAVRYNFRVADTRFIGVDLAWREGSADLVANETGVAVIDGDGQILDAGWTRGVEQTIGWADRAAGDGGAVMFRRRAARGRQREGPAALRDAGRAEVWPLEGQRQ
jgi:hypothetical protein